MKKIKWHKLNDKQKGKIRGVSPKVFIPGPINMTSNRIIEILKNYGKDHLLIFGILNEKYIEGFESFPQFKTLNEKKLVNSIKKLDNKYLNNLLILNHQSNHKKYIIRELQPKQILWVNGSWKYSLHYKSEFWEAFDLKTKQTKISPFATEKGAKTYAKKISNQNKADIAKKLKKLQTIKNPSKEDFMRFCFDVSRSSWDWTSEAGTLITKDNQVIGYAHNKVIPYESAMMHRGSLKEKHKTPIGENLEFTETSHAEVGAIINAAHSSKSLENCNLYSTKFPCPFCARVIADTKIEKIYYSGEYANDLGYKTLKESGKELIKI